MFTEQKRKRGETRWEGGGGGIIGGRRGKRGGRTLVTKPGGLEALAVHHVARGGAGGEGALLQAVDKVCVCRKGLDQGSGSELEEGECLHTILERHAT